MAWTVATNNANSKTKASSVRKASKRKKQTGQTITRSDAKSNCLVSAPKRRRAVTKPESRSRRNSKIVDLEKLNDEQLLDTRLCDLDISVDAPWLKPRIEKLYQELANRGIRYRPHVWLSDEWFSPDGVPGIAIPFCLAHPRLKSLERKQMHEIEGGTATSCMQILRHEAGHALDTAYRLHRKKVYKQVFGNYHLPYPDSYRPKPDSKKFVLHLEPWYAQSHPAEDFAETVAVWLKPRSPWRREYEGWPALKKLELVDTLLSDCGQTPIKVKSRAKVDTASRNRTTLRELYTQRKACYRTRRPTSFDYDLNRLFPAKLSSRVKRMTAATFLQRNRSELSRVVAQWTGEYRYNVSQVLREMIDRCRELDLRVSGNEMEVKQKAMVMLTVQTMNYLHGGHHRVAL